MPTEAGPSEPTPVADIDATARALADRWRAGDQMDLRFRAACGGELAGLRVAFKRSAYLRNFVFRFAELLSDRLDRNLIAKALSGHHEDYEL